jgi:hypothetical protein
MSAYLQRALFSPKFVSILNTKKENKGVQKKIYSHDDEEHKRAPPKEDYLFIFRMQIKCCCVKLISSGVEG